MEEFHKSHNAGTILLLGLIAGFFLYFLTEVDYSLQSNAKGNDIYEEALSEYVTQTSQNSASNAPEESDSAFVSVEESENAASESEAVSAEETESEEASSEEASSEPEEMSSVEESTEESIAEEPEEDELLLSALVQAQIAQAKERSVDFPALQTLNSGTVGWLYSPEGTIDYPVVQSIDNTYYLKHLIDGTYNKNGTLFVDYRCRIGIDCNTIIYGHNMRTEVMFGTLLNYEDESFYQRYPVLFWYTPDGLWMLELVAGYHTTSQDENCYLPAFASPEQIDALLQNAREKSTFLSPVTVSQDDVLFTLSTCDYASEDGRYVILAKAVYLNSEN